MTSVEVDPFDLPEWLGTSDVTWEALSGLRAGHLVIGRLTGECAGDVVPCDLLAVDEAYPAPVVGDDLRLAAHRAWRHGQVALLTRDDRATLAVPGRGFEADRVLDAIERLAKAVGALPERYAVHLRLGGD